SAQAAQRSKQWQVWRGAAPKKTQTKNTEGEACGRMEGGGQAGKKKTPKRARGSAKEAGEMAPKERGAGKTPILHLHRRLKANRARVAWLLQNKPRAANRQRKNDLHPTGLLKLLPVMHVSLTG